MQMEETIQCVIMNAITEVQYCSLVVILVHMSRKYTSILLQHLYKATIKNVLIVIYTVHYINGIFETILKYCLHLMFTVSVLFRT